MQTSVGDLTEFIFRCDYSSLQEFMSVRPFRVISEQRKTMFPKVESHQIDIINKDTLSEDEVVASDVPPR